MIEALLKQPECVAGDVIAVCPHKKIASHWWKLEAPDTVTYPDKCVAGYLLACSDCVTLALGKPEKIDVRRHLEVKGTKT